MNRIHNWSPDGSGIATDGTAHKGILNLNQLRVGCYGSGIRSIQEHKSQGGGGRIPRGSSVKLHFDGRERGWNGNIVDNNLSKQKMYLIRGDIQGARGPGNNCWAKLNLAVGSSSKWKIIGKVDSQVHTASDRIVDIECKSVQRWYRFGVIGTDCKICSDKTHLGENRGHQ